MTLADRSDRLILALYGAMLFTTAIGLDFVFRGTERMGLVACSLCIRTGMYAVGVLSSVHDVSRIVYVPVWLAIGEVSGIALIWLAYLKDHRIPRPRLSLRFLLAWSSADATSASCSFLRRSSTRPISWWWVS